MKQFHSIAALKELCSHLPNRDLHSEKATYERQKTLLKPPGSLGELETLVGWLAAWQKRVIPKLNKINVLIFAGNHGVTEENVTPYPSSITELMIANFHQGKAAINQLANCIDAQLHIIPVNHLQKTRNFCLMPAMEEHIFLEAVSTGYHAVPTDTDLLCLGEMGIGNTTVASALSAALFPETTENWIDQGTGSTGDYLTRKKQAVQRALTQHQAILEDPLQIARCLGGYELAALLGATLAARHLNIPTLLDGFVCTSAVAPLWKFNHHALDHTRLSHLSAEKGHLLLANHLHLSPLLNLKMRLGEGSGAALAVSILQAALSCYTGMNTYEEAGLPTPHE